MAHLFKTTLVWCLTLGLTVISSVANADPYTPMPGTSERRLLLDTLRPVAEHDLGAPVEFVVEHLLVDGDYALAFVHGQRPGSVPIDLAQTPLHLRDAEPLSLIDGPLLIAFLNQSSGQWRVSNSCVGCTDAWWVGLDCPNYAAIYDVIFSRTGVCEGR